MYWNNVDVVSSYYIRWTFLNITSEEQLHMWNVYIIYAQIKQNAQWNKYLDKLVGKNNAQYMMRPSLLFISTLHVVVWVFVTL